MGYISAFIHSGPTASTIVMKRLSLSFSLVGIHMTHSWNDQTDQGFPVCNKSHMKKKHKHQQISVIGRRADDDQMRLN